MEGVPDVEKTEDGAVKKARTDDPPSPVAVAAAPFGSPAALPGAK